MARREAVDVCKKKLPQKLEETIGSQSGPKEKKEMFKKQEQPKLSPNAIAFRDSCRKVEDAIREISQSPVSLDSILNNELTTLDWNTRQALLNAVASARFRCPAANVASVSGANYDTRRGFETRSK
jgi:hypothetical protein